MKKIILAMLFCTGLVFPAAFGGDDSMEIHLANTLYVLFKMTDANCLMNSNDYHERTFVYNGMPVTAFKSKTSAWVGFFKKLSKNDLPQNAQVYIKSEYSDWTIDNVAMFFDNDTEICYFAEITQNKEHLILKIEPSGSIKVFTCMNVEHHVN
jgi:hypothetical protein